MAQLPPRDLLDEVRRQSGGTPEERILEDLRLGEQLLDLFLATQTPGTTREQARRILQRYKHKGRQRSAVIEALGG